MCIKGSRGDFRLGPFSKRLGGGGREFARFDRSYLRRRKNILFFLETRLLKGARGRLAPYLATGLPLWVWGEPPRVDVFDGDDDDSDEKKILSRDIIRKARSVMRISSPQWPSQRQRVPRGNAPHTVNRITHSKSKKKQDQTTRRFKFHVEHTAQPERGALSAAAPKGQWLAGLS